MSRLVVLSGPDAGLQFPLPADAPVTIGRSPPSSLRLRDSRLSRVACRMLPAEDGWLVEDLGSVTGVRINGCRTDRARLRAGDRLTLGGTILQIASDALDDRDPEADAALPTESVQLLKRHSAGDRLAASEIFARYTARLVALARSRMSPKLARRIDPEDVVQSAYRSFFRRDWRAPQDAAVSGRLWALLAGITVKKVLRQAEAHSAQKRAISVECPSTEESDVADILCRSVDGEPTPAEAAALSDELDRIARELPPLERQIWDLRLEGWDYEEIGTRVGRSTRTVRRVIDRLRSELEARLIGAHFGPQ